ncbi:Na+/H+ antiporter [Periweissella cryptocerci]|uniref:Na+/H+ antiporter n=1 Tax=Periweissella cryptocerci TaxID=2506420 RepID=A0A4P6YXE6_9LACO|nr:Na+/H+ antiporter [Periweissella cryptocerci]
MPILELIILLITLVILGNVISHFIPKLPVSIIQIVLGFIAALFMHTTIHLDTDWFLLLFIAPLLFNDAYRFPKRELWELRGPIFGNAIFLVFITTFVGGLMIHWMIPPMPMSVAFALAAILSPTDPVAVQAIAKSANLPDNIMHLVAGESLINDASGLVAFKFALAATLTGTFHIMTATGTFFYMAVFGVVIGLVMMMAINWVRDLLRRKGIDDVVFHVVLQLLSPFIIFFVAEELLHASGVIAVVAAGILANVHTDKNVEDSPELTLVGFSTWSIVAYILNGILFVILGIELPVATHIGHGSSEVNILSAVGYAAAVWLVIFIIRVLWAYLSQVTHRIFTKDENSEKPTWRVAILSGLTGVRGAITMAGVLSVPAFMDDGTRFPTHDLMLSIAAMTILISLVVAAIALPIMTRADKVVNPDIANLKKLFAEGLAPAPQFMTEARARIFILQLAVRTLENLRRETNQSAAYDLILEYQFLIRRIQLKYQSNTALTPIIRDEVELRTIGLEIERNRLMKLLADEEISMLVYHSETRRIDRAEADLENYIHQHPTFSSKWIELAIRRFFRNARIWLSDDHTTALQAQYDLVRHETAKAAIKGLSAYLDKKDSDKVYDYHAVYNLIIQYRNRIEKVKDSKLDNQTQYDHQRAELEVAALSTQREGVQQLYEQHRISRQTAISLRQYINYAENATLVDPTEE